MPKLPLYTQTCSRALLLSADDSFRIFHTGLQDEKVRGGAQDFRYRIIYGDTLVIKVTKFIVLAQIK